MTSAERPVRDEYQFGALGWGVLLGVAAGGAVMIWLTTALVAGDGARWPVLLVALLFLLPVIGGGALVGWLVGVLVQAVQGPRKR